MERETPRKIGFPKYFSPREQLLDQVVNREYDVDNNRTVWKSFFHEVKQTDSCYILNCFILYSTFPFLREFLHFACFLLERNGKKECRSFSSNIYA